MEDTVRGRAQARRLLNRLAPTEKASTQKASTEGHGLAPLLLAVCDSNVSHSPYVEGFLRVGLGPDAAGFELGSAGLDVRPGEPMDSTVLRELASVGLDGGAHLATQLDLDRLDRAALVLTATREQRSRVVAMAPRVVRHTFTTRQLGRILASAPVPGAAPRSLPAEERLRLMLLTVAAHRAALPLSRPIDDDVPAWPTSGTGRHRTTHARTRAVALQRSSLEPLVSALLPLG